MERRTFIQSTVAALTMTLSGLETLASGFERTPRMPVLFLGHGSPMNAIEENEFVRGFRDAAKTIPRPKAILCISAHWYIKGTKLTASMAPKTIYDFGGFPEALYKVKYPAKGDPALAIEAASLIGPEAKMDHDWGLDHGAWTVLKHFYPKADVPVVQLSIDNTRAAAFHYDLGKRLNSLRDRGVLIVGSGNLVHNLYLVDFANIDRDNYGFDWAIEARAKLNDLILKGDHKSLIDHGKLGKAVQLAVPTPDHYLPLLYCLAMQGDGDELMLFNDKLVAGSLTMTSVRLGRTL